MTRIPTPTSPKLRIIAAIALCAALAWLAAIASVSSVSLLPPSIKPRQLAIAGASARVIVDYPRSLLSDRLATDGDYRTLQKRAVLLGNLMASPPVSRLVARRAGLRPQQLAAKARVTAAVQDAFSDVVSEKRATELREAALQFQLEVQPDPVVPTLGVYGQAPTVAEAERIADAAVPALREYLQSLGTREGADPSRQIVLEQPAPARGAIINGGAKGEIFGLTFVFVFLLGIFALLLGGKLRRRLAGGSGLRAPDAAPAGEAWLPAGGSAPRVRPSPAFGPAFAWHPLAMTPLVAGAGALTAPGTVRRTADQRLATVSRRAALKAGDWPRTTRVLPWMIAGLIWIVWLVPFNEIQLSYSLPIDLKFDRLVLPFLVATWALALGAGGVGAPRMRLTWIHIGIAGVALAYLLSLVVGARQLNQSLELDTSVKQLTLLVAYISLFLIVASSVRRTEVPAFLKYTLVLAVICALGTIWEYRFSYNIFYSAAHAVLPGIFTVGEAEASAVDAIGRRLVRGPGAVPLEAVTMLAMGLPIAVVGLIQSKVTRARILYGIAVAIILAATVSTERKSALMAPLSVFVTLAYFRRRELMRLAPLGVVIGVMMLALTPGAAQSVVGQVSGSKSGVPTVSDRTSDYDAVRPDVFSHIAFGRGFGSFKPPVHRVLDMELLGTIVQVGVFGLLAYFFMIGTIVAVARRPIRERRPLEAAAALSAAGAAIVLLVVSSLFDVMSFPHCPYIALWMAGLLAVVVRRDPEPEPGAAWSS
ncbi:MAG TPA: hypothetical protein VGC59_08345 [Solirubrobacteraceae bacterium]